MPREPKNASPLEKLKHYCAYQERCHAEVKEKLRKLEVPFYEHDGIIAALIAENFLNEERFAKLFARSKMRQKQWGAQKIKQALKAKRVSDYCIRVAMKELEAAEYGEVLWKTAERKWATLRHETAFVRRNKLAQHLLRKGFESEAVWQVVGRLAGEGEF
jgi:regulatory protein